MKIRALSWSAPPVARLPIQLIFGITFLFYYFGWLLLPALGIGCILIVVNFFLSLYLAKLEKAVLQRIDERMNASTEAINNIKILKLNSWVDYFLDKVSRLRVKELNAINKRWLFRAFQIAISFLMSPTFMISTFTIFFLTGHTMVLSTAFAARHVFYTIDEPMHWIPQFIATFTEFIVSMKRIQKFLFCYEINQKLVESENDYCKENNIGILIQKSSFSWAGSQSDKSKDKTEVKKSEERDEKSKQVSKRVYTINEEYQTLDDEDTEGKVDQLHEEESIISVVSSGEQTLISSIELKDINLQINQGEFVCIIGQVGSGKSSLLSAILGDMLYLSDETIQAYQHRVLDDGLRRELHEAQQREASVIRLGGSVSYVQQVPWIQNKTIRDNILFGKRMDEQRYNQVIEMCELGPDLGLFPGGDLTEIGEKGINLSGGQKARVSLARAIYADNDIMLMDDPVSALDANVKRKLKDVFTTELSHKTRVLVTHAVDFIDCVDRIIVMEAGRIKYDGTYEELQHHEEIKHIIEVLAHQAHNEDSDEEEESKEDNSDAIQEISNTSYISDEGTRITDEENKEVISVGWGIYKQFFLQSQIWIVYLSTFPLLAVYAYFLARLSIVFGYWIKESEEEPHYHNYPYVLLYPFGYSLILMFIFIIMTRGFTRAGRFLHEKMFRRVLSAPINIYFDKTPTGVILNRFSKDINLIDNEISRKLLWTTESFVAFGYNLLVAIFAMPWVICVLPFVALICGILTKFYMKTYRELNRMNRVTHSPILSQLSETLSGSSTIRSFSKSEYFIGQNFQKINKNINTGFWSNSIRRWFSVRVEFTSRIIIITAMVLMIYLRDVVNPVLLGAFLVHMMRMNNELIWSLQFLTEFESRLVSFERCIKILEIPQEASDSFDSEAPKDWPRLGEIAFNNFSLKYRPNTPIVLNNLTFHINDGEKIGVVGRTGAGKSTLCLAL